MNIAAEHEKNRQIHEHKFDELIQRLAKDQAEVHQLKQKAEAQSHAKQALQGCNKLKAMNKI